MRREGSQEGSVANFKTMDVHTQSEYRHYDRLFKLHSLDVNTGRNE